MFRIQASLLLSVSCSLAVSAGSVTSFYYDFTSDGGTVGEPIGLDVPGTFGNHSSDRSFIEGAEYADIFSFANNGVTLEVQGGVVEPSDSYRSSDETFQGAADGVYVGRFYGGLGVGFETNPLNIDDNQHTTDDSRGRDFLVLDFDQEVKLAALEFNYYGSLFKDQYGNRAYSDNYVDVQIYTRDFISDIYEDTLLGEYRIDSDTDKILLGDGVKAQTFVVTPSEGKDIVEANYKTYREKFEYFKLRGAAGHAHAVPSPTAALAGAIGLVGLTARRRRRG